MVAWQTGGGGHLPTSRPQKPHNKKPEKQKQKGSPPSRPESESKGSAGAGGGSSMPNLFTDLGDDLQLTDESDDWGEDGAGTVTSQSLLSCRAVWFVILHAYFNSSVINLIILFLNEINWMNHIIQPM